MASEARYDGYAAWYAEHLTGFTLRATPLLDEWLGPGSGRCLDLGCGGGAHLGTLAQLGWRVVGVDLSADQLRVARQRGGTRLIQADAIRLPFADASFEAVVSLFIHTDVDDWNAVVSEAARVVRTGGRVLYIGTHPCFVGPFSRYVGSAPPTLYPGYRTVERVYSGPGLGDGLRRRVGVRHVPLAELVNTIVRAGLQIHRVDEPGDEDFPRLLALEAIRQ